MSGMSRAAVDPSVEVVYPESDGKPLADNTRQYEEIVRIKENLDALLTDDFVAADLLWYPVEGNPRICQAPDVMVAIGRPKGHRRSYKQWEEDNVAPQVVFEILSHTNTYLEMEKKERFYGRHGVEEYYVYDPDSNELLGWMRTEGAWRDIPDMSAWTSPRLGIRFELTETNLNLYHPDGRPFESFVDLIRRASDAESRASDAESRAAEAESRASEAEIRAEEAARDAEQARIENERLKEKLRALGIDQA